MSVIRLPQTILTQTRSHFFSRPGEHFAFFLANWTWSEDRPIFLVHDVVLIPDEDLVWQRDGVSVDPAIVIDVINQAIPGQTCLIEAHNHGGEKPRFSRTDQEGFQEFIPYVLESMPGRPYAATVWGDHTIYGEYFLPDGRRDAIDSITVTGHKMSQLVSLSHDIDSQSPVFSRQLPWFTAEGQRQIGSLRIGIVGCGGIGSQVVQNLAHLGVHDFVLVDDDTADETNLNRLVTATQADIGTPKTILARRLIRSLAPESRVCSIEAPLQQEHSLDRLKRVDILFGCLDNDGARLILNELAVAYRIPYFDLATGIEAEDGAVLIAGGRVAAVLPAGPCLNCMGEIDAEEASYFLMSEEDRRDTLARGYVTGMDIPAPAVVSLNAAVAATGVNEFCIFLTGTRDVNIFSEIDLLGVDRPITGQWLTPRRIQQDYSCVPCTLAGYGDRSDIYRYARI